MQFITQFKKQHIAYKVMTVLIIGFITFFLARVLKNTIVSFRFPNELLEPANINLTNALLSGRVPYLRSNIVPNGVEPPINFEYPFLHSILAALLSFVFGGNVITAHYVISFLSLVATAILGGMVIARNSRTTLGAFLGFLLLMYCHWRYGYISASPDGLGLCITMCALYVSCRKNIKYRPFIAAILTVAAFYTKQYYAGVCVAIFIYMWCYSRKEALKYFAWCVALLLSTIVVITLCWPLFWSYSILCLFHGTFQGWGIEGFIQLFNQLKYIGFIFAGLIAVLIVALIKNVKSQKSSMASNEKQPQKEKKAGRIHEGDELPLFLIQIPVQLLVLLVVGRNDGAYLTYFMQLLIPSLVIATIILMEKMEINGSEVIFMGFYALLCVFTVYFGWGRLPLHMMSHDDVANWERAYDLMDTYRDKGEIAHCHATAYYAIEHGDSVFCTGHDGDIRQDTYDDWKNSSFQQVIFPDFGNICEENLAYREVMKEKIENHEVSLVVLNNKSNMYINEKKLQEMGYEMVDSMELQLGNMAYPTSFWSYVED